MKFNRKFEVDGFQYRFELTDTNEVVFYILSGKDKKGKPLSIDTGDTTWTPIDSDPVTPTSDINSTKRPLKVIAMVIDLIRQAVLREKPLQFWFKASDTRRRRIYTNLIRTVEQKTGYKYFPNGEYPNRFYFHLR